jgi:hypothetical protein
MYPKLAAILALPTPCDSHQGEKPDPTGSATGFGRANLYACGGVVAPGAQDDGMAVLGLLAASWLLTRFGRRNQPTARQ